MQWPYRLPGRTGGPDSRARPRTRISDSLDALADTRREAVVATRERDLTPALRNALLGVGLIALVASLSMITWAKPAQVRVAASTIFATMEPLTASAATHAEGARNRIVSGDVTRDNLALLRSICSEYRDSACIAKCDEVLAALPSPKR